MEQVFGAATVDYVSAEDITSSTVATPQDPQENDFLVRFTGSDLNVVGLWPTKHLSQRLSEWVRESEEEKRLLLSLCHWQHRLIDYNGHYTAYLMQQLSDDEFEKISEDFAIEPVPRDPRLLVADLARLLKLTRIDFTQSDLASLFVTTEECVEEAVSLLKERRSQLGKLAER